MNLRQNFKTLCSTPGMPGAWMRWQLRRLRLRPVVCLMGGAQVAGFRDFSEYWSVRHMAPSESEVSFIRKYAGRQGMMLDVGANIGCMALTMAHLRPGLPMHLFEPSPETFGILQSNIAPHRANPMTAHQMAVGRAGGRTAFLNDAKAPALNRLISVENQADERSIYVDVISLDEFIGSQGGLDVAFLKIDVEGHEPEVILGAARLFRDRACSAGLVELCPANLKQAGHSVAGLLSAVNSQGYRLHHLLPDGAAGAEVTEGNSGHVELANAALLPGRS